MQMVEDDSKIIYRSNRFEYTIFLMSYAEGGGYNVHFGSVGSVSMSFRNAELSLQRHIVNFIYPASWSATDPKPGKISVTLLSVFK
jgi:hypothetical protein